LKSKRSMVKTLRRRTGTGDVVDFRHTIWLSSGVCQISKDNGGD